MIRRFLLGALTAVLISAACAQLTALANPLASTPVPAYQQDKGTLCKWKAAGIEFVVPTGWELEINKDGEPSVSQVQGSGYYLASFGLLPQDASALSPEQQFKAAQEGVLVSAKKDFKGLEAGKVEEFTQNGIKGRRQPFVGKVDGVDTVGMVAVLSAERPIMIYIQVNASDFAKDSRVILESIKKIEDR